MNMIKRIMFLAVVLFFVNTAFAQSITDDKVVEIIMSEQKKGTSQQDIASILLKKGVTMEQLQRVKKKAEEGEYSFDGMDDYDEDAESEKKIDRSRKKSTDDKNTKKTKKTKKDARIREQPENPFLVEEEEKMLERELVSILYPEDDEPEEIFGHNIFNNELLTFEPSMNIPTPEKYILGAGDDVIIDIWGVSQQNIQQTISPDGKIFIDGVGLVNMAGMTVAQSEQYLKDMLAEVYGGSQIAVSLGSVRSIQVQVVGEVLTPGTFTVSALSTAFNALYAAGGINDVGTLRDIKIYRDGKEIATIDIYDFIFNGNSSGDVRLLDNDIISVGAYKEIVAVDGCVKRPMKYEMQEGETLLKAISYAGGFAGDAYTENLNITRKNGREYSMHTVSRSEAATFTLKDGDSIMVDAMLDRYSNMIEIMGAVFYPGKYELGTKISTVGELVAAAGGVAEDAFLGRAVLQHRNFDNTIETEALDIKGILDGSVADRPLRNNDLLFIPDNTQMLGEQTVSIGGEINLPGKYRFAKNTTIEDLILQAGGLTRAATVMKIDVFRHILDPKSIAYSEELTENYSFALKDGFLVDGAADFVLEPFDEVFVRRNPSYHAVSIVKVNGCVNFEGGYAMTNKTYRLSDLVSAAGGLTSLAYLKGANLSRKMTKEERQQREQAMRTSQIQMLEESISESDKKLNVALLDSLIELKMDMNDTYPVAINLQEAIANPGSNSDITLREGDVLNVPEYNPTIRVNGEVRNPLSISYESGKNVKYYIKHAGGYSGNAKKSGIYIVYMNGNVVKVSKRSRKVVEPGCEIVVPRKRSANRLSAAEMATIGTSTASIATMIVSIISLLK